jgi:hypothetical protein
MKRTVLVLGILAMATNAHAIATPSFTVQGVLRNNMGQLQSMAISPQVRFFDAQTGGNQLGPIYGFPTTPVQNGLFTLSSTDATIGSWILSASQVWVELTITGIGTFPRQQVMSSLTAVEAHTADSLISSYVVPIANGGTGSSTQNFVDLTTNQTVMGNKSFGGTTVFQNNATSAEAVQLIADGFGGLALYAEATGTQAAAASFNGLVIVQTQLSAGAPQTPSGVEPLNTFGPNSGLSMDDRNTSGGGSRWVIYPAAGNLWIWSGAANGNLFAFNSSGAAFKPGGGSWLNLSDERLKNIGATFKRGLKELMRLEPVRYRYRPGNAMDAPSESEHIGFAAQSVQKVIPEAVLENSEGYLMVDNDPILWTMLNAIKEQQTTIQEQRSLIDGLRAQNAEMRDRLVRVEHAVTSLKRVER